MSDAQTKYARVPTDKLELVLGVGRAGLTTWRGRRLAEVRREVEEMEHELALREKKEIISR